MMKRRGYPDRRGMGAQSDFISDSFVPSERQRAEQMMRARVLLEGAFSREQVGAMFSLSDEEISEALRR